MKPLNRRDAISMDCSFLRAMSRCAFAPPCEIITEILGLSVPFKLRLMEAMEIPLGGTVLDVGTGTGLVPILLLQGRPDLTVVGLDADPAILERAQQNAVRAGIFPIFKQGCAQRLPFPARSLDAAVCSLTLHHLSTEARQAACYEMARVLRKGAWCYVADFAPPQTAWASLFGLLARLVCFKHIRDNFRSAIPRLLEEAGFVDIEELFHTPWSVSVYRVRL